MHSGMENVIPKGSALPAAGQSISVLVGPPVPVADLLSAAAHGNWPEERLYTAIAERVGGALAELKARLDGLPVEQVGGHVQARLPAHELTAADFVWVSGRVRV